MATEHPHDAATERFLTEKKSNVIASKWEVWSYYSYATGCNQLTLVYFAPTIFQYLVSLQAGDNGTLVFLGSEKTVNSVILYSRGISFAIQVVILLLTGSFADYGTWRPWGLIFWTVVGWGVGLSWLGLQSPDKWHAAIGMSIVGSIIYSMCYTFYTAAFPRLARNTSEVRVKAEQYERGEITKEEYDHVETNQKTKISNYSWIWQTGGCVVMLAIALGILFGVKADDSIENNLYGYAIVVAFTTGAWILLSLPWFALEKRRPGQTIPPGLNMFTVGFWQLYRAMKAIWRLKQSFAYLIAYILLCDTINTSFLVIQTLQNEITNYNAITLCYLLIIQNATMIVGTYTFWAVQTWLKLSPKTLVNVSVFSVIVICIWGMIGIWTQEFGFHKVWEFWAFQVFYGFFVCPCYSYTNIVMSELTPRGKEFLFFSLFGIVSLASTFVGPFISGAIIDADTRPDKPGNNSLPFYFLFGVGIICFIIVVFFVDIEKSKVEQADFLEKEEIAQKRIAGVSGTELNEPETISGASNSSAVKLVKHIDVKDIDVSDRNSDEV